MKHLVHSLLASSVLAGAAFASDLDLRVESGGQSHLVVSPGEPVPYEVVAELVDAQNEGLAGIVFDLSFDGGDLTQGDAPASGPMQNFVSPVGLSNPAGYGGTESDGVLLGVGGAQNTIEQSFAPQPSGSVVTGVAHPGSEEVVVSGTVTAPTQFGTYTLRLENVMANVIRLGENGTPFWAVDPAGEGSHVDLVLEVVSLSTDVASLSLLSGGVQTFSLDGGADNAGVMYFLMGSASGTDPGIATAPFGIVLPLNVDGYLFFSLANPNQPPFAGGLGVLDGVGRATATFTLPADSDPALAGVTLDHAWVTLDGASITLTSNAESVTFVP